MGAMFAMTQIQVSAIGSFAGVADPYAPAEDALLYASSCVSSFHCSFLFGVFYINLVQPQHVNFDPVGTAHFVAPAV